MSVIQSIDLFSIDNLENVNNSVLSAPPMRTITQQNLVAKVEENEAFKKKSEALQKELDEKNEEINELKQEVASMKQAFQDLKLDLGIFKIQLKLQYENEVDINVLTSLNAILNVIV